MLEPMRDKLGRDGTQVCRQLLVECVAGAFESRHQDVVGELEAGKEHLDPGNIVGKQRGIARCEGL